MTKAEVINYDRKLGVLGFPCHAEFAKTVGRSAVWCCVCVFPPLLFVLLYVSRKEFAETVGSSDLVSVCASLLSCS